MAKKQGTPSPAPKKQQETSAEGGRLSRSTIERKVREYRRILTLTRRPTRDEFSTIAKVAAIGIVIIGAVGFLIYLAMVQAPANIGISNATHSQQTAPANTQASTLPSKVSNATNRSASTSTNLTRNSSTKPAKKA